MVIQGIQEFEADIHMCEPANHAALRNERSSAVACTVSWWVRPKASRSSMAISACWPAKKKLVTHNVTRIQQVLRILEFRGSVRSGAVVEDLHFVYQKPPKVSLFCKYGLSSRQNMSVDIRIV